MAEDVFETGAVHSAVEEVVIMVRGAEKKAPADSQIGETLRTLALEANMSRFKAYNQDDDVISKDQAEATFSGEGITRVTLEQFDKGGQ